MNIRCWILAAALTTSASSQAQDGVVCPTTGAANLMTSICWSCFFPIVIGGAQTGAGPVPTITAGPTCLCPGRLFGYPTPGVTVGMWQPTHIIEAVRQPYCSPTLGTSLSTTVDLSDLGMFGGSQPRSEGNDRSFYNMHLFRFPVAMILDQLQDSYCVSDQGVDMDLTYMTEIDPSWVDSQLAVALAPETVLFANPVAIAACVAEATAMLAGSPPVDPLFWCAGAWGLNYPPSGHGSTGGSIIRDTSAASGRFLNLLHRRGLMTMTAGPAAVCADIPVVKTPKFQYRMQTMFPVPELLFNHWYGEPTPRWGLGRSVPGYGEDIAYLLWSFQECCANY